MVMCHGKVEHVPHIVRARPVCGTGRNVRTSTSHFPCLEPPSCCYAPSTAIYWTYVDTAQNICHFATADHQHNVLRHIFYGASFYCTVPISGRCCYTQHIL